MALSNLANEPRREITEQVVGVVLMGLYIATTIAIVWGLGAKKPEDWVLGTLLVAISLPALALLLVGLTVAVHGLGDLACGWLGKLGLDPRPTQRYRR